MDVDGIVELCVVLSLVVLPALGLTARFALKPIVDAIIRLKEGGVFPGSVAGGLPDIALLTSEVRHLRDEVAQLQQSVTQLQDVETFNRSLAGESEAPRIAPAAPEPETFAP
jgi:hypothetical protein